MSKPKKDEEELPDLFRRKPRDRPKSDNRVEIDVLINLNIRILKVLREILKELRKT